MNCERRTAETGERIPALEGIGESVRPEREREQAKDRKPSLDKEPPNPEESAPPPRERAIEPTPSRERTPEPEAPGREERIEVDLGL